MATSSPHDLPKDYIISGVHVMESKLLGEGAYGVVKLGKYYGLPCAVKKLKASMFPAGMQNLDQQTEIILQSFYNECEKLSKIRHPNVVQLLGVYADKRSRLPVIVMELMHESLSRLLYRRKTLPFYIEINILHDVAQALAYLHSFKPPIVHRDLSSNNILLSEELRAKITDLGVAKVAKGSFLNWDNTPAPGTLVYMPPEVRKIPADLTPAMDIFALGINAIQIRTHKFPRPGPEFSTGRLGFSKMVPEKDRRKDHLDLIAKSHPMKPIILDCLKDNPRDRPTALQLCERLERIKESGDYMQNHQMAQMKDSEKEATKQRISELEEMVIQLRDELREKSSELTKTQKELQRERDYTAQLLEANAREKLKYEMGQNGMSRSISLDSDSSKKRNKFQLKLKKLHKSFRKARPSNPAEAAITGAGSVSSQSGESRTGDEIGSGSSSPSSLPSTSATITSNAASALPPVDITEVTVEDGEEASGGAIHSYKVKPLTWYSHHCLPQGLQGSTLRVHEFGDRLYVCSGATNDGLPNKAIFHCSVRNLTRWIRADPDVPQYYSASAVVQGEVVLISGLGAVDGKCTGSLSSYDSKAHVWVQRLPPLPTPRSSASAFIYGDYLVVVGGQSDNGDPLNIVEVLHIPTQTWESAAPLPIKVAGASVVVCGDMAYLVGGYDRESCLQAVYCTSIRSILASCRRFFSFGEKVISRGIWKQLHDCPFTKMTALCSGNQLLAFGGEEVTKAAKSHAAEWIWCYDSENNTWTPVQGMPSARKLCCVTMLPNNNMVIIGGEPDYCRIDIAEIV